MFSAKKVLLLLAVTLGSLSPFASADWGWWGGGITVLPDLRVAKVEESVLANGYGYLYARVTIVNESSGTSDPCYVRVRILGAYPVTKYAYVPSMPPNSGLGMDVFLGQSIMGSPGLVTEVYVDPFGQVSEKNEYNNVGYHIAPPW